MRNKLIRLAALTALTLATPALAQSTGSIRIGAHRGFWNCDEASHTENSIASLRTAQEYDLWGSEFDVHLTADDVIVVHHDAHIQGQTSRRTPTVSLSSISSRTARLCLPSTST